MHRLYVLLSLCAGVMLPLSAQNGLIGQGFGIGNPGDIQPFDQGAGSSRILIRQSSGTGNQFFRIVRNGGGDNSEFGPAATCPDDDQFVTNGTGDAFQGVANCGKAFAIDVPNTTDFYVFKTPDPVATTEFTFFRIEGAIVELNSGFTAQFPPADPGGFVATDQTVTVGNLVSGGFPDGQAAYLHYTTDGFATSTVLPMTDIGGGLINATIPGQPDGTVVTYYLFTSGDRIAPLADGTDADYQTINQENNNGTNYTYTVDRTLPVTYAAFTGERVKTDAVRLEWATANEDRANFFTLQCSTNEGRSWIDRARITAVNRVTGADYDYLDEDVPTGDLQYRLQQTDFEGAFAHSAIIRVAAGSGSLEVWPQPATGELYLLVPTETAGTTAYLTDLGGRTLRTVVLTQGRQTVGCEGLAAGVYVLRGEGIKTRRIIIR